MNLQPTLENELILMRPLEAGDHDGLFKVAKDPLIWQQHPCPDRHQKQEFSKFFADSIQSKGALITIDKSNQKIIGSSRYKIITGAPRAIEIGWSFLARNYWGGQYNKAMKTLMIQHAFQSMDDVIFYVGEENIRSQKAVEKIGGKRITNPIFNHLIRKNESEWTYRISKTDHNSLD